MNLPSTTRNTSADSAATLSPVAGIPLYSPSWVPHHGRATKTRSSSAITSSRAMWRSGKDSKYVEAAALDHLDDTLVHKEELADRVEVPAVEDTLVVRADIVLVVLGHFTLPSSMRHTFGAPARRGAGIPLFAPPEMTCGIRRRLGTRGHVEPPGVERLTWCSTVFGLMNRRSCDLPVGDPSARSRSTSVSLLEEGAASAGPRGPSRRACA